jgi:tetratricopeptide (TPR) repeat protein
MPPLANGSMTKQELIHYIEQPLSITEEATQKLLQLKQDFPYCHTFHLLHLKGLKNTNDIEFEKYLPLTSLNAPSRDILYQLIIKTKLREKIESIEQEISQSIVEETLVETPPTVEESKEQQELSKQVVDEVEQIILEELAHASYSVEALAEEEEKVTEIAEVEPQDEVSERSFTSWLRPKEQPSAKAAAFDLIDKFIKENPSISKAKTDAPSPIAVEKADIVDNDDLVTETLARVYMKQGHYDKAIKTYEKLSLKIPEKNAFFASQIEVIKELKKQK